MKLALVHDWLKEIGGAERVLIELHNLYPEAPIYVLFYDPNFVRQWLPNAHIHASFLQNIPSITKVYSFFAWLMPMATESFDLCEKDTVLSSSVIFSKGLVLKPTTNHICYCYSPTRQIWDNNKTRNSWVQRTFKHFLRLWDHAAADRVDQFIAISKTVQARIKKYYHRDSIVIYPPITLQAGSNHAEPRQNSSEFCARPQLPASRSFRLDLTQPNRYYLVVARLYQSKNIDVAIQAFNKLKYPLVIIGDGPAQSELESMAHENITFLGRLTDAEIGEYYANCRAFIMPQEEDFGLTAVEAMSFGKPVVALRRGGAIETVIEGKTGEFFDDPIPEGLADAIRRLNDTYNKYDPAFIHNHTAQFSLEYFKQQIVHVLS